MSEKKQLNDEELEKVSGGDKTITTAGDISKYSEYTTELSFDQAVQGETYLFRPSTLTKLWYYGKLSNKYKSFFGAGVYDIKIEDGFNGTNIFKVSDYDTLEVDETGGWRAYKK